MPEPDPDGPVKRFLNENSELFGYNATLLDGARVIRQFVTTHDMRTVVWEQHLDEIPVYAGLLIGHIAKNGELVSLSSHFVPAPAQAADAAVANRAAIQAEPPISGKEAVFIASTNIGETLTIDEVRSLDSASGPEKRQRFTAPSLQGDAVARLVWLPMNRQTMALCWRVILAGQTSDESFEVVCDAQTGEILVRSSLTHHFTPSAFQVFPSDSPSPFSPGHSSPSTNQPALVSRISITNTMSTIASPDGWVMAGTNRTIGNNVDAHTDVRGENPLYNAELSVFNPPRPLGSNMGGVLVFDFPLDLTVSPATTNNQNAAVVNAFYWCNWMHDKLYELGFTEAAGNYQQTNFGRGGLGGDAVLVDVQSRSQATPTPLFNGAFFQLQDEGTSPRIRLRLYDGPTPDRDVAFDAEIILHEYTHGLNNRRVAGGASGSLNPIQSRTMDEGWADFYGITLLSEASDDIGGNWGRGAYANFLSLGLMENYYYGNRHFPYSTNLSKNPLTFINIDPSVVNTNAPRSPISSQIDGSVYARQVWCVVLWDMRANLIGKYGFESGNQSTLQLVTDGMNLTPYQPTFVQGRDAILLADRVNTGGANQKEIWRAFAKRGMGFGAVAPTNTSLSGAVQSFITPPEGGVYWSYTTGNGIYSSPAVAPDGTIYIGSTDSNLYAFNPDGTTKSGSWPYATGRAIFSSPAIAGDGTVYVGSYNGKLYALNPDGTLKSGWPYTVGSSDVFCSPALAPDGTIYIGAHSYYMRALNPNGTLKWTYTNSNTLYSSPAVAPDGTLYFGGMDGNVHAVAAAGTAKTGWPVPTGNSVDSSPALARDGTIYVGSYDGKLYSLSPNGTTNWTYSTGSPVRSSPVIAPDGTIYVGSENYKLYAFTPGGSNKWNYTTGFYVWGSPTVGADGTIFVGSYDGKLYALNSDGTLKWSYNTGGAIYSSPTLSTNGTLYVGSANYKLYALSNTTSLAHSTWPKFRQNAWQTGNPATLALNSGVRQTNGQFQFEITGLTGMSCAIEDSHNLMDWTPTGLTSTNFLQVTLTNGTASVTDTNADGYNYRFYRVRSGPILSWNSLGFISMTLPTNQTVIANQLNNAAGSNTLAVLMPSVPLNTRVDKWNSTSQAFETSIFEENDDSQQVWTAPDMTLNPGEGCLIWPGATMTLTLVGDVPQGILSTSIPTNYCIRSSMVPQNAAIDPTLSFPSTNSDRVDRWNVVTGSYYMHTNNGTSWLPVVPTPTVAESFWIQNNTGAARTWNRTFSVW